MSAPIYSFLNQVTWIEGGNQIPSWHDRGIRHGFEGLDYELPPFGVHLKQVHSAHIVEVAQEGSEGIVGQGDALATQLMSHRIAVKTADCVPILLHHPEIGLAIHAGWRGLAQDILAESVRFVEAKGIDPSKCEWAIGPAISPASFEIGPEVLEHFQNHPAYSSDLAWSAFKGARDRWHLDLQQLAVLRLMRFGFEPQRISVLRSDTKTNEALWHSYRRSGEKAGRNWSWLELGSATLGALS